MATLKLKLFAPRSTDYRALSISATADQTRSTDRWHFSGDTVRFRGVERSRARRANKACSAKTTAKPDGGT